MNNESHQQSQEKPSSPNSRNFLLSLYKQDVFIKTLILICFYLIVTVSAKLDLDQRGQDYLDRTLVKASATFALARSLNSVISVIQESEFSVSFGLGTEIAFGEALDPINDLVEQFSMVMLASSASLGIQKVLMDIGTWLGLKIFLIALAMLLLGLCLPHKGMVSKIGEKLMILAIIVRVAIPMTTSICAFIAQQHFLQEKYETATQAVTQTQEELQEIKPLTVEELNLPTPQQESSTTIPDSSSFQEPIVTPTPVGNVNESQVVPPEQATTNSAPHESSQAWYDLRQYNPTQLVAGLQAQLSTMGTQIAHFVDMVTGLQVQLSIIGTQIAHFIDMVTGFITMLYTRYNPAQLVSSIQAQISAVKTQVANLIDKLANITTYLTDLIIVFIVETIVLPLITLWGMVKVIEAIIGSSSRLKFPA